MKRPGRRKPKVRIKAQPMERGDEYLAVVLEIPEEIVLKALRHQIAAKLPKKMKDHSEQPVVVTMGEVDEFNQHLRVRAMVKRPRALSDGTHDEVRDSLLNSEPVIRPKRESDDDELPF
jgi:hypothetical protein